MTDRDIDIRIEHAVKSASDDFWGNIVDHFPEVSTGDLSPSMAMTLEMKMEEAVREWLELNVV